LIAVAEAQLIASARGNMTENLKRVLEVARVTPIDWRAYLNNVIAESERERYNWNRPNRRIHDEFLPTLKNEKITIAIGVDTSGSLFSTKYLSQFIGHINDIKNSRDVDIIMLEADCRVKKITFKEAHDPLHVPGMHGGGGTSFVPVFDTLYNDEVYRDFTETRPEFLIYFTDGDGCFPEDIYNNRTLWVGTKKFDPPFGEFVLMTD